MASRTAMIVLLFAATGTSVVLEFTQNPKNQEVGLGNPVTLQCAVGGAEVTHWLHDASPITPDSNTVINGGTLEIPAFQESQSGEYRCVAGNPPQVSHPGVLSYFNQRTFTAHPTDFPVYLIPEDLISNNPREVAAFQCVFEDIGYGALPTISWEKDVNGTITDVELSGRYVPFQYDHTGYLQLHFPVDSDDGTRVRCVASNPSNPSDPSVISDWAEVILSDQMRPDNFTVFSTEPPSPEVHFIEGQDLVLGCSKTTPNISLGIGWFRGPTQFFSQGLISLGVFKFQGEVEVYGFTNIRLNRSVNHTGFSYTCRFMTTTQRSKTTTVVPPPPVSDPVYVDVSVQGYYPVVPVRSLKLSPNGTDSFTRWWFRGSLITNSPKYSIDPNDSYSLTIADLEFSDAGVYQAEEVDRSPSTLFNFDIVITGNECEFGAHDCHPSALCSDTQSSFTCTCSPGYVGDGRNCLDVDECATDTHSCNSSLDRLCVNTNGSYDCVCMEGYTEGQSSVCQVKGSVDGDDDDDGLEDWEIALIVVLLFIFLLLCCCCLLCCLCFCWRRRKKRTYYAEKNEIRYSKDLDKYRSEDEKEGV